MKRNVKYLTALLGIAAIVFMVYSCNEAHSAPNNTKTLDSNVAAEKAPQDYTKELRPEDVTFIMVDYLEGLINGVHSITPETFQKNIRAYSKIGKTFDLPVIILGDEGSFRGKFAPFVFKDHPKAPHIERHTVSAWKEPKFVTEVERIGRKKLVMAGVSIDICIMELALDALEAGYEVYVVVDASGTDTKLNETAAMMRMQQAGAVMTNWGSLVSQLMTDWAGPHGAEVGKLYADYSDWVPSE